MAIKLSGNDLTFGENTVAQSGQRLITKSGIRGRVLSGSRETGFHWNGHRFPPPPAGCVLYYPGYPAQGSTIQDFSGQGNNGTITGATWKRLPSGLWYLDFDGADDEIRVSHHASQLLTTGGSIIAWIRPDGIGEGNEGRIVDKSAGTQGNSGFAFRCLATNRMSFIINGAGSKQSANNSVIFGDGKYYNVIVTWDSSGLISHYANGSLSGTPATGSDPSGITTTNDLVIGNRSQAMDRTFDGGEGEILICNRDLSAVEASHYYNQTRGRFN